MCIQRLPVELIAKTLHGMTLNDIMNVTRSCAYFRQISLDNRQLWVHAKDSSKLPLPVDETTETVDAALLPRLACRAILLEHKWEEHIIFPIRSIEPSTIYALPTWAQPPTGEPMGFRNPSIFHLLPGAQMFLIGERRQLCLYDVEGRHEHRLNDLPASIMSVEWAVVDKKISITLCLRSGANLAKSRQCHSAENLHASTEVQRFFHAPLHGSHLGPCRPEFLFFLDLVTGKKMYLYRTEDVPPISIIYAALHPEPPLKVVLLSGNRDRRINPMRSLEVVENISQAPRAPSIAQNNGWDTRVLVRRFIGTIEASDDSDPTQRLNKRESEQFLLRTRGDTGTIADINTRSIAPMYSLQSCVEEPQSIMPPNTRPVTLADECGQFWLCETGSGPPFMFMRRRDRIDFCRYSPELGSMDRVQSLDLETTRPPSVGGAILIHKNPSDPSIKQDSVLLWPVYQNFGG
ncbi:hypothetical protein B0H19DRAFT_1065970 [Mycena capillaripes]|nr:hypothetical protein B0H19DRAFT_1065970 [Mycena capillaripes]